MMRSWRNASIVLCGLLLVVASARACLAIAFEDQVAEQGKPVTTTDEAQGWPAGSVAFLNGPLRGAGWHFIFSECPNDVQRFEYFATTTAEANGVIERFAQIKSPLEIRISPDDGVTHSTLIAQKPGAPRAKVMFSLGSQPVLDKWYERLPIDANGDRVWGDHRYQEKPTAARPTLHIYVGAGAIRLSELKIPDSITVAHLLNPHERFKRSDIAVLREIDEFLKKREAPR